MLIPRYWSRAESHATTPDGRPIHIRVWRGSRSSPSDAQSLADEAAARMADRIQRGAGFPERYAYGDRPLREEVVREIPAGAETPDAALTRNAYGALVLNAARAFFIDVDMEQSDTPGASRASSASTSSHTPSSAPESPADALWNAVDSLPLPGPLKSILGAFRPPRREPPTPEAAPPARPAATPVPQPPASQSAALDRLRSWVAARPEWRVRVYRTHSGLRYLVTHATFSPTDPEAEATMRALGADPHYIKLCQVQKSFRARLTPKPWRIGVPNPPVRFPYDSASEEQAQRQWEAAYDRASQGRATAQFVEEMGGGTEHPDVAAIRALHDEHTHATSGLPLA